MDLIERPGYYSEHLVTGKLVLTNPDGPEAAAELTRLTAELAEARRAAHEALERAAAEVERGRLNKHGSGDPQIIEIATAIRSLKGEYK